MGRMFNLYYKVRSAFKDFTYGVRNLYRWFHIVWDDRDWDWIYLADIMRFKINNMAEHQIRCNNHEDANELYLEMKAVSGQLDFVMDYDGGNHEEEVKKALEGIGDAISHRMRYWWD